VGSAALPDSRRYAIFARGAVPISRFSKEEPMRSHGLLAVVVLFSCLAAAGVAVADSVHLTNGDKISGKVVGVDDKTVTIESEALGKITIKKSLVQSVQFGDAPKEADKGGIDPRILKDVKKQFPELTSPEAGAVFGKMAEDYVAGKLTAQDLRKEAMHINNEFKQIAKELGPEAIAGAKPYLATLQKFLDSLPDDKKYTAKDYARVGELTCWLKADVDADQVTELIQQIEATRGGVEMVVAHRDPKFKFLSCIWNAPVTQEKLDKLQKLKPVERIEPAFDGKHAYRSGRP
jgi:hypothetical protein